MAMGALLLLQGIPQDPQVRARAARKRGPVPPPGPGGDRLRDLHARPRRPRRQLEHRRRAHQGLHARRDHRPALLAVLHAGGSRRRRAAARAETAAREGKYEAEGWRVRKDGSRFWASVVIDRDLRRAGGKLIGFAKVTRDLTERRGAGLERAAAPVAEDGGDRPAHRRRRARLQQPADGHHRQPRDAAAPRCGRRRTSALHALDRQRACAARSARRR